MLCAANAALSYDTSELGVCALCPFLQRVMAYDHVASIKKTKKAFVIPALEIVLDDGVRGSKVGVPVHAYSHYVDSLSLLGTGGISPPGSGVVFPLLCRIIRHVLQGCQAAVAATSVCALVCVWCSRQLFVCLLFHADAIGGGGMSYLAVHIV